MRIKKAGGKVFGAVLTAAERKAMDMEINRQIVEADRRYADDIDAMVLYTLHVHLGFGKKRLRKFYDAFSAEHDRLIQYYQMPDDYTWLCKISIHAPRVGRDSKFDDFTPSNLHKRYKRVLARPKNTREKGKIKQKLAYIHAFSAFLGCEGSGTFCALVLRTQYR